VAVDHALMVHPFVATLWLIHLYLAQHDLAVDFRREYWVAGGRVLHGLSPYAWTKGEIAIGVSFPYPAFAAIVFVPFSLLSRGASEGVFIALSMVALIAALRVLTVRDWRLYALVFLWWPVVAAWQTANVTLLLVLGLALTWRHRDRPFVTGLIGAVLLSLKPFTWPLLLWLVATRRYRAAGWAVAVGAGLNLVAWSILGFGGVSQFLHLTGDVTDALYRTGYGAVALAAHLGLSRAAGTVLEIVLAAAVALACLVVGRRGRDRQALALCVGLMLVASPLVWNHYLALLIAPLAIARPRLDRMWVLPLALWVCPSIGVATWHAALTWVVVSWLVFRLGAQVPAAATRHRPPVADRHPTAAAIGGA
jgi:hypothetical protein